MPHCGIHGCSSTSWKPGASVNRGRMPSEITNVARETARPAPLIALAASRGKKASTTAAMIGSQTIVLSRLILVPARDPQGSAPALSYEAAGTPLRAPVKSVSSEDPDEHHHATEQ